MSSNRYRYKIPGILGGLLFGVMVLIGMVWILIIAVERMERVDQATLEHNCKHYGIAMNDWATERGYNEPCPPTPRG